MILHRTALPCPGLPWTSGLYCLAELDSGFSGKVSFVPIDTGVYYHFPTSLEVL